MRGGLRALLLLALLWGGGAEAETRVALVIGNAAYEAAPALANPGNDARDVSVALEGLGFEVIRRIDLDRAGMEAAADRFARAARTADVALLYYAGHGFQAAGRNYLVPTDARLSGAADLRAQTVPLELFLAALEEAPGARLVFLDACRDDPFGGALDDPAVSDGLARVGSAAGFLFAYATQPDNVAYDGTGRNSFFTEAVLNHLYTPGQDVGDMMIAVRRDVLAATGGRQVPWDNSSLTRRVVLDTSPVTASEETMLYQVAAREAEPALMQLYLDRYPQGAHREAAEAALGPGQGATRRLTPDDAEARAERLWQLARRTRMRTLLDYYLDRYPDGARADEARRLLALLPSPDDTAPGPLCERLATHPRDATDSNPGVPFAQLSRRALPAVQACAAAVTGAPELPHYMALLARATFAAGDVLRAVELYREAAARGDLRALVSLALLTEAGNGVEKDPEGALALMRAAAERGSPDAMVNMAVALLQGDGVDPDPAAAIDLLERAAEAGSPIATFNLGFLAMEGVAGRPEDAVALFVRAARGGHLTGWRTAAAVLDEGRGVPADPARAADLFLRAVAEDDGATLELLATGADAWTRETLREVQVRLAAAGHYGAALDGLPGPSMTAALTAWREGGFTPEVLGPLDV